MSEYSELLKDPRWQKKRLKILERDKWTCKKCGDNETTLHIHHLKYQKGKNPWEYNNKDLITICEDCHIVIERLKLEDIGYKDCKIYKSDGWERGTKIMFCSIKKVCQMEFYNKKGEWMAGYNLDRDIPGIIKILKTTQNE